MVIHPSIQAVKRDPVNHQVAFLIGDKARNYILQGRDPGSAYRRSTNPLIIHLENSLKIEGDFRMIIESHINAFHWCLA
jgi:hypothetical protein